MGLVCPSSLSSKPVPNHGCLMLLLGTLVSLPEKSPNEIMGSELISMQK